jgi:hypothetical protein
MTHTPLNTDLQMSLNRLLFFKQDDGSNSAVAQKKALQFSATTQQQQQQQQHRSMTATHQHNQKSGSKYTLPLCIGCTEYMWDVDGSANVGR